MTSLQDLCCDRNLGEKVDIIVKLTKPRMRLEVGCYREVRFKDLYALFIGVGEDLWGLACWAGSKRVQDMM